MIDPTLAITPLTCREAARLQRANPFADLEALAEILHRAGCCEQLYNDANQRIRAGTLYLDMAKIILEQITGDGPSWLYTTLTKREQENP